MLFLNIERLRAMSMQLEASQARRKSNDRVVTTIHGTSATVLRRTVLWSSTPLKIESNNNNNNNNNNDGGSSSDG